MESEPPYVYVRGNPVNLVDPSGQIAECQNNDGSKNCKVEVFSSPSWHFPATRHIFIVHTDIKGNKWTIQALPREVIGTKIEDYDWWDPPLDTRPENAPRGRLSVESHFGVNAGERSRDWWIAGPVIVAKGYNACYLKTCLEGAQTYINGKDFSYWRYHQNSNSAARAILKYCGLPQKKPFVF